MVKKLSRYSIVAVAFLIVGQLIGAGILGIPVIAGIIGLFPAIIVMMIICGSMIFTALIFAYEASSQADDFFSFPSLYEKYMGKFAKWLAIGLNMVLLYGLLTAYIAGGSSIIVSLFDINLPTTAIVFLFFLIITGFALLGVSLIKKCNIFLILLLWTSFAALIIFGAKYAKLSHFSHVDLIFIPATIPVIITSFNFSNLIPVVAKNLDWKMSYVWKSIVIGMIIAFVMNTVWIAVGCGVLPLFGVNGGASLVDAYINNTPATVPIAQVVGTPMYLGFALVFSIVAIVSSYVTNALGLMSFNTDLLFNFLRLKNRFIVILMTFIPPVTITLLYPDIFIKVLNVTGGICTASLFGIFPSLVAIIRYKNKLVRTIGVCTTAIFTFSLVYIVCNLTGIVKISLPPNKHNVAEYTHYMNETPMQKLEERVTIKGTKKAK